MQVNAARATHRKDQTHCGLSERGQAPKYEPAGERPHEDGFAAAQIVFAIVQFIGSASLASNATEDGELFLEQVVKRLASIVGPDRGKSARSGRPRNRYRRGSRILFDGGAERVKRAIVSSVFFCNALRYGPGAFKLRRRIEVGALLAAVEFEPTARASPLGIKPGMQDRTAVGTTRARDRPHHSRSPRPDLLLARAILWRALLLFFFGAIRVHVTPVAILPLQ